MPRWLGNYSDGAPRVERRPAVVVEFQGPRAVVRFDDGTSYGIPAQPFRAAGAAEGQRVFLVITWKGKTASDVRVELPAAARPAAPSRAQARVYVKTGERFVTRSRLDARLQQAVAQMAAAFVRPQSDVVMVADDRAGGRSRVLVLVTGDPRAPRGLPATVLGFPVVVQRSAPIVAQRRT